MKIKQSAEDYLEAILVLSKDDNKVRSIDIVNALQFSKPSVSVAMHNLKEAGYIDINEDGHISLLPSGREIAEKIYERHVFLSDLLIRLGVDPVIAADDACKIEHVISNETCDALKKAVKEGKLLG